ncbi:MAG: hypothetical protein WC307_00195 [Candidatus Nanoarchaeia archaeon]|jgi:hypothetical protein
MSEEFTTLDDLPDTTTVTNEPVSVPQKPIPGIIIKESEKPKKWTENKNLAILIGIIGFVAVIIIFYFLFSSAGII